MKASEAVVTRVQGFVTKLQDETNAYYKKHYSNLTPSTIEIEEGSKFYKIVKADGSSRSVHCFIAKSNGDIFKAATWKAPAKHVRGNIFANDFGWSNVNVYGARYLR